MAPSDEGAGFCEAKDWGRDLLHSPLYLSLRLRLTANPPPSDEGGLVRGFLGALRLLEMTGFQRTQASGAKAPEACCMRTVQLWCGASATA